MKQFKGASLVLLSLLLLVLPGCSIFSSTRIPLPEHPRPDFMRADWVNLNGPWQFRFDKDNVGRDQGWQSGSEPFDQQIVVPFPWGSELSGVEDQADIGWYSRDITIPSKWKDQRVFVVVGASDWRTQAWLDGKPLGNHRGGYTPFAFDLTDHIKWGEPQQLVFRVDDTPHPFKLEGKQGYGRAAGIWQTVYLEARPALAIKTIHFTPDIDNEQVTVKAAFNRPAVKVSSLRLKFAGNTGLKPAVQTINPDAEEVLFSVAIPKPHLWSLDDPFLYEVTAELSDGDATDTVQTYFGMRKISVMNLPGTEFPYIALNNKPIYLQTCLDQSYHPEGFYTFPSDKFMRDEILLSKKIGLNGNRIHIKIEVPRKLYWADKLGLLIMADVPNFWGEPNAEARRESEFALLGMIERDYNHPSIFSWVNFNETWGLKSGKDQKFLPKTQEWVRQVYRLTKQLDPTRLVEDNSPCNRDHVETDINSWHAYLPGWEWRSFMEKECRETYPGSKWNYIGNNVQDNDPMMNSECGNVWGYEGSTGDVDWSWDYHIMMNEFRRHPKMCGWLYTEHHDVINEWNGYYRFDRSEKFTGMDRLVDGMSLLDLHSDVYLSPGEGICHTVAPASNVSVPLHLSCLTEKPLGDNLTIAFDLFGWDNLGRRHSWWKSERKVAYRPWLLQELAPVEVPMPDTNALAVLGMVVKDASGAIVHRNFVSFVVTTGQAPRDETVTVGGVKTRLVRFAPKDYTAADFTRRVWDAMYGLKVNAAGTGYIEYRIPWPQGLSVDEVASARFLVEASAKELFGKDVVGAKKEEGDFMRGKGTHDPVSNPNAYAMTDEVLYPSAVTVSAAGEALKTFDLPDDPADHQGILSWHSQLRDRKLREAGSYGWLLEAPLTDSALRKAVEAGEIVLRLSVDETLPGGVAIYGESFGRYPLDPTLAFELK